MKVSNPLTIVAIFAGVAETFATGALVLLPETMQAKFIDFVMFFPVLIVVTFFLILVFKPQVLYAPSDFANEEHFLHANNLKDVVAQETEKVLNEAKQKNQISGDLKALSKRVADLTVRGLEDEMDKRVLSYMLERPREAFEPRGLGHILATSKHATLDSLLRLEKMEKVVSGMDGDIKVWQAKT
ncbi:hypothetical protein ABMX86_22150 [Vibrio vulnificus]|uniref:hypothetical protein n=1 Tax=Vibrio TaxID=662 RepID=UPI001A241DA3|nr:hypothetical protein [Vibrio cholerae]EGR0234706.1 ArsR family transcriptional regulator [Vibrio vulnificus]ELF4909395.1 hypothetical protein [Vibrio vulnificus]ELF6258789.1 hypothetical protein [Vibrio vulnificus]ELH0867320.1 hypothetical protein [Vibrio vulnificus]ELH7844059.1 hypothetical protein [Vibrio vulnificus]